MKDTSIVKVKRLMNSTSLGKDLTKEYIDYFKTVVKDLAEEHNLPQLEFGVNNNIDGYAGYDAANNRYAFNENNAITNEYVGTFRAYTTSDEVAKAEAKKNLNSKFFVLGVPIHEFTHYMQNEVRSQKDITKMDFKAITYAKEDLLVEKNRKYYLEKHDEFFVELEADYKANAAMEEVMEEIKHGRNGDLFRANYKNKKENLVNKIDKYFEPGGMSDEISNKTDETMKWLPEKDVDKILKRYPVLSLVYNEHGGKKSLDQVLEEKEKLQRENLGNLEAFANITKLYAAIINTDKQYRDEMKIKKEKEAASSEKKDDAPKSTPATRGYERKPYDNGVIPDMPKTKENKEIEREEQQPIIPQPEVRHVEKEEIEEITGKREEDSYGMDMNEQYKADRKREEISRRNAQDLEQQEIKKDQGFSYGR